MVQSIALMQHGLIQGILLLFMDSPYVKGAFGCYLYHAHWANRAPLSSLCKPWTWLPARDMP